MCSILLFFIVYLPDSVSYFQSCDGRQEKTRNIYIYGGNYITSVPTCTQKPIYNIINLCSPRKHIRGEAHHKCANERTDLPGGSLPPPLLLIQAFLAHTAKAHRYHYLPRRHDQRHADIMKQSTEETWDEHEKSSEV